MYKNSEYVKTNEVPRTNEYYYQELMGAMKSIAVKVNTDLQTPLLNEDATVSMEQYGLEAKKLATHLNAIKEREMYWISEKQGIPQTTVTETMHTEWIKKEQDNKNRKSNLLEMVTTLLLTKGLGSDYVVVRASKYDDYKGIDNIIVHKTTGAVLCAFDDVHDRKQGDSEKKKIKFVEQSARQGGSTIEYGFTFNNGQLIKKQLTNIPKFYMAFSVSELEDALQAVKTDTVDSLDQAEIPYYNLMIENFINQVPLLRKYGQGSQFLANVNEFEKLLTTLKKNI